MPDLLTQVVVLGLVGGTFIGILAYLSWRDPYPDDIYRPGHEPPGYVPPWAAVQHQPQPVAPPEQDQNFDWMTWISEAEHTLITGANRSGKTVITHHLATSRARQPRHFVLVCDPDARPGMWPNCQVVGSGDNWPEIDSALSHVEEETNLRRQKRQQGARGFDPVTVVLSELGDILHECPTARRLLEKTLRRGAKINISFIADVQDRQAGTLKLEGATHLLKNFTAQAEVSKDRQGQRWITIDNQSYPIPVLDDPEKLADAYARRHPQVVKPAPTNGHTNGHELPPERSNQMNGSSQHPNAIEHTPERSTTTVQEAETALPASVHELQALAKALTLHTTGSSKQAALEQAFSCKKGGGEAWARASRLFDQAVRKSAEDT